jgi:hypothetical protein
MSFKRACVCVWQWAGGAAGVASQLGALSVLVPGPARGNDLRGPVRGCEVLPVTVTRYYGHWHCQ